MMKTIRIDTRDRVQMIDVGAQVAATVAESGVQSGLCVVFVPHTTAAVTINENTDPAVPRDLLAFLQELVPAGGLYTHLEGNSDSHIKAGIIGSAVNVIIEHGRLQLGTWQTIFFCEFDGPRSRHLYVKIVADYPLARPQSPV
jgi:secondary thiamine-phosphate synthase enzyme